MRRRVTVQPTRAVPATHALASRSVEEAVDAKTQALRSPSPAQAHEREAPETDGTPASVGPVLTTVAQARAAVLDVRTGGRVVAVRGRCAGCGRVGRLVHFDGVLRARPRAPD